MGRRFEGRGVEKDTLDVGERMLAKTKEVIDVDKRALIG